MKILGILAILALLAGCKSANEDSILGTWTMHMVIQDGKDVSPEHNPYEERFFILRADSTFESGGRPYGKNTGRYLYDPEAGTLILDSDTGPDDDSQWMIEIRNDTMYWQGYGSEWAEEFRIIQIRDYRSQAIQSSG